MKDPVPCGVLIGDGRWVCLCRADRGKQPAAVIQPPHVERCPKCQAVQPERDFGPNPFGRERR